MSLLDKIKSYAALGAERAEAVGQEIFGQALAKMDGQFNNLSANAMASAQGNGQQFVKTAVEAYDANKMNEQYQQMVANEKIKLDTEPLKPNGIKPLDVKDLSVHAAELMANIGAIYQHRATLEEIEKGPTGNGITLAQNAKGKAEIKFNELTGKKEGGGHELGS